MGVTSAREGMDPFDFELLAGVAPLPTLYRTSSIVGPRIQRGASGKVASAAEADHGGGGCCSVWWRADTLLRQLPSAPLLKYPKLGTRYEKSRIKIDVSAREEAVVCRGRWCGYTVKRVEEAGV